MRGRGLWNVRVKRSGCRVSVGKLERESHFEDVGSGVRVILKWI
jgi:hypothetical protein